MTPGFAVARFVLAGVSRLGLTVLPRQGGGAMDEQLILRVSFCDFIYFAKP